MRFLGWCGRVVHKTAVYANVALLCAILYSIAHFSTATVLKFENGYKRMMREQKRQVAVGEVIQSQRAWVVMSDFLRNQVIATQAELHGAETQLKVLEYEMYHFVRTLQAVDYEAYERTVNEIVDPEIPENLLFPDPFDPKFNDPVDDDEEV